MAIAIELIKKLRDDTGAGIMDAKTALEKAQGDYDAAKAALYKKGIASADKRVGRAVGEGAVEAYIHSDGKIGAIVDVRCETDFVARNPEFHKLARDIAMQIVAMNPAHVSRAAVPSDAADGADSVLLEQPFIRNPKITVGDLVKDFIAKFGENIVVNGFHRISLGGR